MSRELPAICSWIDTAISLSLNGGMKNPEVHLSPYWYEQLLIFKGLPHGLGVLSQWGPYRDGRPLTTWREKYKLHFLDSGASYLSVWDDEGRHMLPLKSDAYWKRQLELSDAQTASLLPGLEKEPMPKPRAYPRG